MADLQIFINSFKNIIASALGKSHIILSKKKHIFFSKFYYEFKKTGTVNNKIIPNIYLGLGFKFGLQRIRDLAIVCP